jgi:7-carboxy-7-deazaguanine synthase
MGAEPSTTRGGIAPVRLKITEIFYSLQGEANAVGFPTVFVRLTGCPLRCQYCDTAYAFGGGQWWSIDDVIREVRRLALRHVCVTGGEPLAQRACMDLLVRLCDEGYEVSLETSGAIDWQGVDARVSKVVDVKTPASGEVGRNLLALLPGLSAHDQVKFVLCDRADYEWARALLRTLDLAPQVTVLFSPSHHSLPPRDLADWILADRLPVRLQLQLHKLLWGETPGK